MNRKTEKSVWWEVRVSYSNTPADPGPWGTEWIWGRYARREAAVEALKRCRRERQVSFLVRVTRTRRRKTTS